MCEQSFKKYNRLLTKNDFDGLKGQSRKRDFSILRFYFKQSANEFNATRIGISISKKVGCAVLRNRLKRLIRENFRASQSKFLSLDVLVVVVPRKNVRNDSNLEGKLRNNLNDFFREINNAA